MKNNKLIRVVLFVVILLVGCVLTLVVLPQLVPFIQHIIEERRYKVAEPMRRLLFCEKLSSGLSMDETRKIVAQFGAYTSDERDADTIGEKSIAIAFSDDRVFEQFGGMFWLVFRYGKYEKAMYLAQLGDSGRNYVEFKCNR